VVLEFTVMGEPKGKGRPRFNPQNPHSRPRTPEGTLVYENLIGWEFRSQCKNKFPEKEPLEMLIKAYYAIPKSESKKRKVLMEQGEIRPTKKPDIDNVVKVYADALNHVAYHDDSQVVKIVCEKYYSNEPRVEVRLNSLKEDNQDED
jgi:Holliday junction resolvase RusA-like endonuclease